MRTFLPGASVAYVLVALALLIPQPFLRDTTPDEAWFLQVVRRLMAGEAPYRDFFLGVTPFSLYLTVPLATLFGTEVLVLRVLQAGIKALTSLLIVRCATMLGLSRLSALLAGLVYLIIAPPMADSLYSPTANLFLMATLALSLRGHHSGQLKAWAMAGLTSGLAFASKQNIGLYAVVAAVLAAWISLGRRNLPCVLLTLLPGFLLGSLVPLLPVVFQGGLLKFIEYGFLKEAYLRYAQLSYQEALVEGIRVLLAAPGGAEQRLWYASYTFIYLTIPMTIISLALVMALNAAMRRELAVLALFSGAALLGLYPRAGISHAVIFVPYAVLGLTIAASSLANAPRMGRVLQVSRRLAGAALLVFMVVFLSLPPLRLASGQWLWSDLPHFSTIPLPRSRIEAARAVVGYLTPQLRQGQVFVAGEWASLYYLVSDGHNPTPFDFPLATAMGINGQELVIEAIAHGSISQVAVCDRPESSPLAPRRVLVYVYTSLVLLSRAGPCELYGSPPMLGSTSRASFGFPLHPNSNF